jgi:Xaa-Pro aminopeptidase
VGHGLGLTGVGYEMPLIGPKDTTPLEPGMVLCLETPYYVLGLGGLQPEDMVVITASGCERLNPACPLEIPEAGA